MVVIGESAGDTIELYDPRTDSWRDGASLQNGRLHHTATLLADGRVLVVGGESDAGSMASAELYDPVTETWRTVDSMSDERSGHTATLLPDGRVLVAGGQRNYQAIGSIEIFDPTPERWTATGGMYYARAWHTATLLPTGQLLIMGGDDGSQSGMAGGEVYDPAMPHLGANLHEARFRHSATLLLDGRVLLVGGSDGQQNYKASAEIYDRRRGIAAAWRPQIASVTSPLVPGDQLQVTGSGFRGIGEASGGNGAQHSPSNYPLVHIQRLASEHQRWLPVDPNTAFSDGAVSTAALSVFPPGPARVTVFVNGVPSVAATVIVAVPEPICEVWHETTLIADGATAAIDFGSTSVGAPIVRSFTIRNSGTADLSLGTCTIFGDGFSLAGPFPTGPVAPNATVTFSIQLDATEVGGVDCMVSFDNGDPHATPYDFRVRGTVIAAAPEEATVYLPLITR